TLRYIIFYLYMLLLPPKPPLFPYTTLFRSEGAKLPPFPPLFSVNPTANTFRKALKPTKISNAQVLSLKPEKRVSFNKSLGFSPRSEEHTSELQSRENLVCRLLLEKKNNQSK